MTIREQILDVLGNCGPKKLTDLVRILEEFDPKNAVGTVHPIKSQVLTMLNSGDLELTLDRYLKIP